MSHLLLWLCSICSVYMYACPTGLLADEPVVIEKDTPDGKVKMTMFRIQAGEADKDGWYFAKSTQGGFSTRFPAKFNDFSVQVRDKDGKVITSYMIGTVTEKNVKFTVTAMPLAEAKSTNLEDFERDLGKQSKVTGQKKLKLNGAEGFEFRAENNRSKAAFRSYKSGDTIYLLIVDAYVDPPPWADLNASINRFMDSFKLPEAGKPLGSK